MNYLDILLIIPLLYGAWKGFKRGLIFEIAMITGLLIGCYLAFKFLHYFESIVSRFITHSEKFLPYITFLIVAVLVIVLVIFLAKLLEQILKITSLNAFNKIGGAVFGVIKYALVLSFLLALFRPVDLRTGIINAQTKNTSLLYNKVLSISHYLFPALQDMKEEFRKRLGERKISINIADGSILI